MKFLILLLLPFFAHSQSLNANFERHFAEVYDKEYLQIEIKYTNTIDLYWDGYVDFITIEGNTGMVFPKISCEKSNQLHLSNLIPGDYYIKFYQEDKLLDCKKIKT
jgi:hypothetical protein